MVERTNNSNTRKYHEIRQRTGTEYFLWNIYRMYNEQRIVISFKEHLQINKKNTAFQQHVSRT